MKTLFSLILISFILSGCTHLITRSGYQAVKSDNKSCDVAILKGPEYNDKPAVKIGTISLSDTGISLACSEEKAREILKNEACAIDADIILITKEYDPDLISTCYRCTAEFYKYIEKDTVGHR